MKTIALTLIAAALGFAQSSENATDKTTSAHSSDKTPVKRTVRRPLPKNTAAPGQKSASQKAHASAPLKPTAAQKANPPVLKVPEGAKLVQPNLYRYTGPDGKTWMYRQTPFGISRWEDTPNLAPHPAPASEPVSVTDLGDSVQFERKTAFGVSKWVRKKTELSDDEKALVANQQEKQAPAPSDKKTPEQQ